MTLAAESLPADGMVLTDPKLIETELVAEDNQFEILVVALSQWFFPWVEGHGKHAGFNTLRYH